MRKSSQFASYLALFAVWFFWGTTYLAIRMSLESFPPLTMISARFIASGLILLIGAKAAGARIPSGRELWLTALYGLIVLGGGNGALVFSELWIPSGLAALFITTSPFWLVGLEAATGGERLRVSTLAGIGVGSCGVILLVAPALTGARVGSNVVNGFLLLQAGCVLWNVGALLQKRQKTNAHPVISGGVQQLATGVVFLVPALLISEHPVHWSMKSSLALLYLVIFGSVVGYSAFIYAMEHLPVAIVSTYTYVNPIVAVFLGWLFYREQFGWREAAAMAIVFAGVAIVKWSAHRSTPDPASCEAAA
ncbi:MAG TPA: EamA family transporter [Bryobacteraceae bacterium]|nr:EamA family transporter [Bryobacteraceae bacterium]